MVVGEKWSDQGSRRNRSADGSEPVTAVFSQVHVLLKCQPHRNERGKLENYRQANVDEHGVHVVNTNARVLQWLWNLVHAWIAVDVHREVETGENRNQ